jgi:hypothetical protein
LKIISPADCPSANMEELFKVVVNNTLNLVHEQFELVKKNKYATIKVRTHV